MNCLVHCLVYIISEEFNTIPNYLWLLRIIKILFTRRLVWLRGGKNSPKKPFYLGNFTTLTSQYYAAVFSGMLRGDCFQRCNRIWHFSVYLLYSFFLDLTVGVRPWRVRTPTPSSRNNSPKQLKSLKRMAARAGKTRRPKTLRKLSWRLPSRRKLFQKWKSAHN